MGAASLCLAIRPHPAQPLLPLQHLREVQRNFSSCVAEPDKDIKLNIPYFSTSVTVWISQYASATVSSIDSSCCTLSAHISPMVPVPGSTGCSITELCQERAHTVTRIFLVPESLKRGWSYSGDWSAQ